MSDPEELPTLLDKATDLEDIAANVILAKLQKLRVVEEMLANYKPCCKFCDAGTLHNIKEVIK